jgi:hypothetical protein
MRKRSYTKYIGSHAKYMIPSLTTQALVFRSRRRPSAKHVGSQNESEPRGSIDRGNRSWPIKLWDLESEDDPGLKPTRALHMHTAYYFCITRKCKKQKNASGTKVGRGGPRKCTLKNPFCRQRSPRPTPPIGSQIRFFVTPN